MNGVIQFGTLFIVHVPEENQQFGVSNSVPFHCRKRPLEPLFTVSFIIVICRRDIFHRRMYAKKALSCNLWTKFFVCVRLMHWTNSSEIKIRDFIVDTKIGSCCWVCPENTQPFQRSLIHCQLFLSQCGLYGWHFTIGILAKTWFLENPSIRRKWWFALVHQIMSPNILNVR